jgi:hypothetical protein
LDKEPGEARAGRDCIAFNPVTGQRGLADSKDHGQIGIGQAKTVQLDLAHVLVDDTGRELEH